ncbi:MULTISPECIES: DeoR/GlpR family DNA-binding transcription regulator [unclassified Streptococcus]|uniref:DeoR/GlpR family DNA-binding transcription regulator n=1 Tax=unclassified Streptococcus TaxID=2608887 RepID=UPI0011B4259A|nr:MULTISPECIES: DeoR/GlpR family DNA-binding transcription regulator [unclassified Streptococcus]TWS94237.1 DeoR/GlpR transcriptional regulator [Streptococcus sp. sy018]TWT14753.1 DeoR/GlpR transcriptional regulator [Streptococcus sp. sy010]
MLKSERKRLIIDKIHQEGVVSLETLVCLLNTSESTVRRDLEELAADKLLRRIHGGAERLPSLQEELSNQQKSVKNIQDKKELALLASGLVNEGDVIFVDAGTTTNCLIEALPELKLTVVTNSIQHASKLVEKGIETMMIGGMVKPTTNANIGSMSVEQINQLNFDKAFLGMNGVNDSYFTTPDLSEASIKTAVIKNSQESYILVDSSKLDQTYFVKVATVEEATVITNRSSVSFVQKLKEKTRVIEA